ncbi:hypothetical protein QUB80_02785 [Chlorogloeopsis sp. ULAP01]|uniref:hypothetical protein n=1 Tax=Chlorogloeopsis sp. ULAP01 TaxID=3056483 RepID=UPI0025AAE344|nr:hypothetical protein [Chlorogloeopsis sp. ULAP01]MDM9379628.1 hypothetical protein [Chlorogloeopsis sp. ULAP01]
MHKSCCIFFYEGYISVAPTIINLAKSLNQEGYLVVIYAKKTQFPEFKAPNDQIITLYFLKGHDIFIISYLYKLFYRIKLGTLVPIIELLIFIFQAFSYTIRNYQLISPQNSIYIGVDTNGSIVALLKSYIFKQKFAYLSLEISPLSYFRKFSKLVKIVEFLAYRKAESIIIQDKDRFKSLCSYNKFQHHKVFYLPNSSSSIDDDVYQCINDVDNSNYFRNKFNLSKDKFPCIVLQAGMINDMVFSKEIAYAFNYIDNGSALVFHERERRDIREPYIKYLKETNSKNLFLSLDPLPFEEIYKVFTSATIGLAFYREVDDNFSQIAKASGKLSFYLRYGRPVIVNSLKSLSELVQKYKIGVVIQNPSEPAEIASAIKQILDNYDFYCKNARICFAEEFDFANQVKPVLTDIRSW